MSKHIRCPKCGSYNVIGVAEIPVKFNIGGTGINIVSNTDDLIGGILDEIEKGTIGIICKTCKFHHITVKATNEDLGITEEVANTDEE